MNRASAIVSTAYGAHVLDLEVATTLDEKARGLQHRRVVPPGTGMMLTYDRPQELDVWTVGMLVPIDVVFVRGDGTVHRTESRVPPGSEARVTSRGPVVAVLELGAGEAERLGIHPGDRVFLFRQAAR